MHSWSPQFRLFFFQRLCQHAIAGALLIFFSISPLNFANQAFSASDFDEQIAPLLIRRCLECHQQPTLSGGLDLSSQAGFEAGGDSGAVVDHTDPELSNLLLRVIDGEMPPPMQGQSQQLPDGEIDVLKKWIQEGARWPEGRTLDLFEKTTSTRAGRDWWSLQPIQRPEVPSLDSGEHQFHPIDAFIRHRLSQAGLVPAPRADRKTLVRRAYFDLHGLPPSRADVEQFVADDRPEAWEELIDELLQSPRYGERWGRYWLDLVRYADTSGYERDQEKTNAWKYRDWVIAAFNNDIPYDVFVTHQLAGDQIENADLRSVIATGFMRLGTWNDEPNEPLDYQYERLEDLVHTTSSAFIGLTVKCARCHGHKFDPITQEDYYRMAACFWPGPIAARDSELLGGPTEEELGYPQVLGWTDITSNPEPLRVLKNGERRQPLQEAIACGPSFLPKIERPFNSSDKAKSGTGFRIELARWITDTQNPLTARVLVNRIWQHHFGQALVRTPNNFGFLADPPTHPELLDWLASEFLNRGQSIKSLHRLILTSETYRQSADHPQYDAYALVDAGNRLRWRAERRRLDAEALRDAMLVVSGEIDLTLGGPGFTPTLSGEALEGLSRKSSAWNASPAGDQLRRSVYMRIQRGLIAPMLNAFDFCDTTQTCGQRDISTVPTQALALLNNDFVHQRSFALAKAIEHYSTEESVQIEQAWSLILSRQPNEQEVVLAKQHLAQLRLEYPALLALQQQQQQVQEKLDLENLQQSLVYTFDARQAVSTEKSQRIAQVLGSSADAQRDLAKPVALQETPTAQPQLVTDAIAGEPAVLFNGAGEFMKIAEPPMTSSEFSIVVVATDCGLGGHREIISNWNSADNVGTSVFLGLTSANQVRFSDAFANAGSIPDPQQPFILVAINDDQDARVYCNGNLLGTLPGGLPQRKLDSPWVIGQQGNIGGEYWQGKIALMQIYNQAFSDPVRESIEARVSERFAIPIEFADRTTVPSKSVEQFALVSLCHVLLNSNEFIYVD